MRVSDLIRQLQGFQYSHGNRELYVYSNLYDYYIGVDRVILSPDEGMCMLDFGYTKSRLLDPYDDDDYSGDYFYD